jgi:formamidopyrimidine-DNA glycosylase
MMPELPEVETVRATLEPLIAGKRIDSVKVRFVKMVEGDVTVFASKLTGRSIQTIGRIGKYLFFHLEDGIFVSHLRMEGKYFLKDSKEPYDKHEHLVLSFEDGSDLRYHDTRKFGTVEWIEADGIARYRKNHRIAFEPLEEGFSGEAFAHRLRHTTRKIKPVLLDQSVIAGLGNIYVDEVLFRARLHPETRADRLTKKKALEVAGHAKDVLVEATRLGGTTIRSYVSSLGVTGRFQNELSVHGRKGEPCPLCQSAIVKITVGGRGTYLCPVCQKKARERK